MYPQHVPAGAVQPRQDDDFVMIPDSLEALQHPRLGDPSCSCLGADALSISGNSTHPIGTSSKRYWFMTSYL
jgi:hypothetical protein